MTFRWPSVLVLLTALLVSACGREAFAPSTETPRDTRPNVLLIVADDVGYSDIGAFGARIDTPNIDALAAEGITLTQFHVFPNCGPTRGSMMTGVDPHSAGMGGNHGAIAENQEGQPGYEGHLRDDVVTIAQLMQGAGYRTYMTGKWHLGAEHNDPASRGFDRSFALLNGAASHWADQAPIIPGSQTRYTRDGELVEELPDDFYSTDYYTDELISYIDSANDAPFFAFLSFTAAHNPLHVPQPYIDKYRGKFDGGWDALATERLERMKSLGLVSQSQEPQPRPDWVMGWHELTAEQQATRARDMEIYAGMIDKMDEQIGRVLEHLSANGDYENTLIVFMSDNGPSRTSITDYLALGGKGADFFAQFDNSLENKGLPGSSTDIGAGWAYAAATPLRLFKGYVAQGGIQVPAIVKMPGGGGMTGIRSNQPVHVMDLMPTFLALAGADYPATFNGKEIVPVQGRSLLPVLSGAPSSDLETRGLGWSAYGMDAYRQGNWKILRLPEPLGNGDWQLYNLAEDPAELHDLASEFPDQASALAAAWDDYAATNGVIQPSNPVAYGKPIIGRTY